MTVLGAETDDRHAPKDVQEGTGIMNPEGTHGMPTLSTSQRFQILQRSNFACHYCGRRAPQYALDLDHVKPRALGGPHHPFNRVAACQECNNGKRASPVLSLELGGKYSFSAREAAAFMLGWEAGWSCERYPTEQETKQAIKVLHGMATLEEVANVMRAADKAS